MEVRQDRVTKDIASNGVTLVRVNIRCPSFAGNPAKTAGRINSFYRAAAAGFLEFAQSHLAARAAADTGRQRPYGALLDYKVCLEREELLCVYIQSGIYTGGAHQSICRRAQLWNCRAGVFADPYPILRRCVKRGKLIDTLAAQAALRSDRGETAFGGVSPAGLRRHFGRANVLLTPNSFVVFYPQSTICPAECGIPEFEVFVRR